VKYSAIVADPPWDHSDGTGVKFMQEYEPSLKARQTSRSPKVAGKPPLPYPVMQVGEIAALPVGELAARDAHLYLWATSRYLRDAYDIAAAWGFKVSIPLVWMKPSRGWLPGGTFYPTAEFLLFARRGSLPAKTRVRHQVFQWPRGVHSRKPEPSYAMVERVSPGPYLELFGRRHRPGWEVWGDQAITMDEEVSAILGSPRRLI
jgi:N6-adenosine-specific RNA methylase IME4